MKNFFIFLGAILFAILLGFGIGKLPWSILFAIALTPAIFIKIGSRTLFLLLPIVFLNSGLFVPGIPGNFSLYQLFAALFIAYVVVTEAVLKNRTSHKWYPENFFAMGIILWIIALMYFRGSGMRILGSNDIGGATYFQIIISLLYYLLASSETCKPKHLQRAGVLLGLLCLLPLMAQGLYELSGGLIWHQMYFFEFGAAQGETAQRVAQGNLSRFTFLSHGAMLIWLGIFLGSKKHNTFWISLLFFILAILFSLLGGYRSTAISTIVFVYIYIFIFVKRKWLLMFSTVGGALILYPILILTIQHFPFAIQRVFSALPGMNVNLDAELHAQGTWLWRQEVWRNAWAEYPRYWFLGRGLTFNPAFISIFPFQQNSVFIAVSMGSFHQATLELLVLFGTPVFVMCVFFYGLFIRRAILTFTKKTWVNARLKGLGMAILIFIIIKAVLGFTGGTSRDLLIHLPMWLIFFNILKNSDHQQGEDNENRRYPA